MPTWWAGLEGHLYPDLYGPIEVWTFVRGIKAHAEIGGQSRWGLEVIKTGTEMSRATALPLYIHLGQLWPSLEEGPVPDADELIRELVPIMEEDDILAHPFTRHPGGFVSKEGEIHPIMFEAIKRGVRVDVGHGSHFSFAVAKKVIDSGIGPFTLEPISTVTTYGFRNRATARRSAPPTRFSALRPSTSPWP